MTETKVSPEGRRSRAPRRRQQEILEAAARVFHEKGYESTSIQDIADSVGILKGSLYYYITSKEDLLFEIIQGVHEEALKNLDRTAAVEGDALQKIRAFVVVHFTHNAHNLVKMAVFFQDFRSLNGERRQLIVEERDLYDSFLRDLIRPGPGRGDRLPRHRAEARCDHGPRDDELDLPLVPAGRRAVRASRSRTPTPTSSSPASPATEPRTSPGHRSQLAPLPPGLEEFEANGSTAARSGGKKRAPAQDGLSSRSPGPTLSGP